MIDLYPTILELAHASVPAGHDIDGHSLVPLLSGKAGAVDRQRPLYAISQGHMADNAISWFVVREGDWKLIVYGTGRENAPQLFNITADPVESAALLAPPAPSSWPKHGRMFQCSTETVAAPSAPPRFRCVADGAPRLGRRSR